MKQGSTQEAGLRLGAREHGRECHVSGVKYHVTPEHVIRDTGTPDTGALPCSHTQSGQAMVETALFSVLAVLLAFGMLSWIPLHRARTQATAAAYGCAQFISQSPNPSLAAQNALRAVEKTLDADWSATLGVTYKVIVSPGSPGGPGGCSVSYQVPVMFRGLGLIDPGGWSEEWYVSRSETWKAKWR